MNRRWRRAYSHSRESAYCLPDCCLLRRQRRVSAAHMRAAAVVGVVTGTSRSPPVSTTLGAATQETSEDPTEDDVDEGSEGYRCFHSEVTGWRIKVRRSGGVQKTGTQTSRPIIAVIILLKDLPR